PANRVERRGKLGCAILAGLLFAAPAALADAKPQQPASTQPTSASGGGGGGGGAIPMLGLMGAGGGGGGGSGDAEASGAIGGGGGGGGGSGGGGGGGINDKAAAFDSGSPGHAPVPAAVWMGIVAAGGIGVWVKSRRKAQA
ncbi:MAG TPA: hypothetical protein VEA69_00545, partial [Tepidisphaeraceae bacterium]|nr:hypothetical protein [Tepidisphaeraceae bacterium]